MSGSQANSITLKNDLGYDASKSKANAQYRRDKLRSKLEDSNQLNFLLRDLNELLVVRKNTVNTTPSLFGDRALSTQIRLIQDNLKISIDSRLKLLNKLLPDDKEITVDDKDNALPELKLTLVKPVESDAA